ncbi:hypothetical protein [Blastococcus saxobsidens]|uniref:Uncharacterized protein n=1 Tax=Blastococcus saxobsidens TaxID=138336 RepID=A0A4Q7Y2A6_9ACTN|nr:hypothetical protein [Blastococcus saxobsidens]RZU30638.1 hypothetical protein BKA19_0259 [Blastococcus saxobsidens]
MTHDRDVRRRAVADLGAALRDLVESAVLTEVPPAQLADVAVAVRQLAERLRADVRALAPDRRKRSC